MSESEQKGSKKKKEKSSKVESIILTLGEVRKLEDAAEAGDKEAQKKLAESEGVETYEEYKSIAMESIEERQKRLSASFDSVLGSYKNMGLAALAGNSKDLVNIGVDDAWKHSIAGLGQSLIEASGVSRQIAELHKSLSENVTSYGSVNALIESALTQSSNFEKLLAKSKALESVISTSDALTERQELFKIAEATKDSLAKMVEDSSITEMLSSFAKTELQDIASNLIPNTLSSMEFASDGVPADSFRLTPEILYAPPSSDIEQTEEIRRSNQLQEEMLQEIRKLRVAIEKSTNVVISKSSKKIAGPTTRTQIRGDVFRRVKDEHPEWSQAKVALVAADELEESVTADTVRNTYRQLGWKWERGDRIR